jgi:DNA-directed RNA polymerase subunit beta'
MTTIENEIFAEKRQARNARDAEVEKRAVKLEADLASWRARAPRPTFAAR